jgi:hypothetical protein
MPEPNARFTFGVQSEALNLNRIEPCHPVLNQFSYAFGTPFVLTISNTTVSLTLLFRWANINVQRCESANEQMNQQNVFLESEEAQRRVPSHFEEHAKPVNILSKVY